MTHGRQPPLLAALWLGCALLGTQPAQATDAPSYWQGRHEGWFWYQDPAELTEGQPVRPRSAKPRELAEFEAMQQDLELRKRIAVMNPSDENLSAYMRLQRKVMDKSQVFAERWQRLLWHEPDLDYSLRGRPTHALAIHVFDEQQRERDAQTVRQLAASHGLLFVFRSDCPFCHRFAPILKRFEQQFGMTVLAISLDGGTLPEYPHARPDNGIAARLDASTVPALYLTHPVRREIRAVGHGLMTDAELLERIAAIGRDAPGMDRTQTRNLP